jgi:hypothetical protein
MLLNFKVKNFRSIKDEITLDLQATSDKTMKSQAVFEQGRTPLLKMAAIYGPNASGKSNLFKAFAVFRMMILESLLRSNTTTDLPNEFFKLSSETENKPSFFEMTFLIGEEIFIYGFELNKKKICAEWLKQKKGNKNLFERKEQEIESNKNYFQEASVALKNQTTERVLFLTVLASNNGKISKQIINFLQKINLIFGAERGNTLNFSFGQFLSDPVMAEKMKNFIVMADFGVTDIKANEKMVSAKEVREIPDKFKELLFREDSKIAERSLQLFHKKYGEEGEEIKDEPLDFFTEESNGTQQWFALSAPLIDTLEGGKILFIDEVDADCIRYFASINFDFNSEKKSKNAH